MTYIRQPSSCNPRPDLLGLKNKRIIITSEPENNQKLNAGFIKMISGNDTIKARGCFQNKEEKIRPTFGLILLCNDIPQFDKDDQAIWERCRCVLFKMKFTNDPKNENERQIDYELKNKIKKWKMQMIKILLIYYKKYKKEGLKPTKNVLQFTKEVREENDIYNQFMEEKTECSEKNVHTSMLYNMFKNWHMISVSSKDIPSSKVFTRELRKHYKVENVKVKGVSSLG